jgi:hypothetical protein
MGQVAGSQATNPTSSIKTTSPASSSNSTKLIYLGTPGGVIRHPSNSRLGSPSETGISNLPRRSVMHNDASGMGNPNGWYWNDGSGGSRSKSSNLPDMGYSGYREGGFSNSKTSDNPRMDKAPQYTSPNIIGGKADNRGGSDVVRGLGGVNDETFGQSSRTNDNPNGYSSLHEKTNELKNAIIDNLKRHVSLPLPIHN